MKLSDLKKYVEAIEAAKSEKNSDPDVRFYVHREEKNIKRFVAAGPLDACYFVDFIIDESQEARDHKICAISKDTEQTDGDFTIPLLIAPFYKG